MSGYIGSQPADSFLSISSQQITGNGGATYTLNSNVTNPEDVAVFVNNVRQNVNTYSVSNNQITLGGTIASSDSCYVVFLGKTLATVNPPSGSVGNNQVSASLINSQTAESSANDSDEILIYDNSATALKKQTRANFLTGVGGTNTPAFSSYITSNQSCSDSTETTVNFDAEDFDTNGAYDTTNKRFVCPSNEAGKYFIFSRVRFSGLNLASQVRIQIRKNGSGIKQAYTYSGGVGTNLYNFTNNNGHLFHEISTLVDLSVGDYIDIGVLVDTNSANYLVQEGSLRGEFSGYKLIE